ncbi:MAG: ATP-binding protein [Parvularcula sp.]
MSDTNIKRPDPSRLSRAHRPHQIRRKKPRAPHGDEPRKWTAWLRDERGRLPVSRLALTIVLTNIFGLLILMAGSIQLTQYRDGLITAKLEGVRAQAQVIAAIMAAVAAEDADCDIIPEGTDAIPCDVSLNEDSVNVIFTRVWPSFEGRVRVFATPDNYDREDITDPAPLLLQDKVLREDVFDVEQLPDISTDGDVAPERGFGQRFADGFVNLFIEPGFRRDAEQRTLTDELTEAFRMPAVRPDPGASSVRYNEEGEIVASVSVPIRKVQAVYGVVTAEIGGIQDLVAQARSAVLDFFWIAVIVSFFMSGLLTLTIAGPIRKLAAAADKVREGVRGTSRIRIPDFPRRKDEIGELSESLRTMTQALYNRIETIDHFAADVSHELKNPLTSIRSAVETLEIAKSEDAKDKLLDVIKKDVTRMDRLITDISNASRLDADLAREARQAIDIAKLLRDIVGSYNDRHHDGVPTVRLLGRNGQQPIYVFGSATTLGQVFRNLIDNAVSFSPPDGTVRVTISALREDDQPMLRISVADDGPGIPDDNLERIFERFYTKRPTGAQFGKNSGLGLAICRQIVESHLGKIRAENRLNADKTERIGAVFHVSLPLRRRA